MNVKCYLSKPISLLDVAKEAVETFIKIRQRSPESRGDRYMLLTFEDPPHNVKAGWKEKLETFIHELNNLRSSILTTQGDALKNTFDLLNLNRMQTGVDTYGHGRFPFYTQPAVVILITDGGHHFVREKKGYLQASKESAPFTVTVEGLQKHKDGLKYPNSNSNPGRELTSRLFRWDQRLFALVLRLPGTPLYDQQIGIVPSDYSPIDSVCEETGGRSFCVTSYRILIQCLESLVQKVHSGVVVEFEKLGADPQVGLAMTKPQLEDSQNSVVAQAMSKPNQEVNRSLPVFPSPSNWRNCRKQIFLLKNSQKETGIWPIPESYWPDCDHVTLPPRTAHPKLLFTCTNQGPVTTSMIFIDRYEVEPCPLTQYILARKHPNECWHTFVKNSYKHCELGFPFGYLQANSSLTRVYLNVLPYNYPALLPLLEELSKTINIDSDPNVERRPALSQLPNMIHRPAYEWRNHFHNYLRTIPFYYRIPLKRALIQLGVHEALVQALIPDTADNYLNVSVVKYLKHMKREAKSKHDYICRQVHEKAGTQVKPFTSEVVVEQLSSVRKEYVTHPLLQDTFFNFRADVNSFSGFVTGYQQSTPVHMSYLSVHYPRDHLVDQYHILRDKFLRPTVQTQDDLSLTHCLPVRVMGDFSEYQKNMPSPLREVESSPGRQHMFGNPFKIDKMVVDETDSVLGPNPNRTIKRKARYSLAECLRCTKKN